MTRIVINNSNGCEVTVLSYGATVVSIKSPDRNGLVEEITLCYDTQEELVTNSGPYFGCIVGRFANRICKGKFSIDGEDYVLAVNNGANALHGGIVGFDKREWQHEAYSENNGNGIRLSCISEDGEEGYPGQLKVEVTYFLSNSSELTISHNATTTRATPINLTNHTYWNLSGDCRRNILGHEMNMSCSRYLPTDDTQIPLGEMASVTGTVLDFTGTGSAGTGKLLSEANEVLPGNGGPGLDNCYVVDGLEDTDWSDLNHQGQPVRHVATLTDSTSGRQLVMHSTQPGVQVYTAIWLPVPVSVPGTTETTGAEAVHSKFSQHYGVCLEGQHFPDSVNHLNFPTTILRPGQRYSHRTVYSFRTC